MAESVPSSPVARFGDLRRALTGPYALRPVTVVVMIAWIWLRGLAAWLAVDGRELVSQLRVLVVVSVVVALAAWVVGSLLSRVRTRRLAHTLVGYALIAVALSAAPMLVSRPQPAVLLIRLLLAVVFLVAMAYLLDTYQHYRSQVARLEAQRLRLAQTRDRSELAIVAARRQLTALVGDRLGPEVRALLTEVRRLQSDSPVPASRLRAVADSVRAVATEKVRRLSHQLGSADPVVAGPAEPTWVNRFGLRAGVFAAILRKLPGDRPFRPLAVGLTFGAGATSLSSVEIAEQAGMTRAGTVLLGCLAVLAVVVAQSVGTGLWQKWIVCWRRRAQVSAVVGLYVVAGLFAALVMYSVLLYSARQSVPSILVGVPIGVVTCSLVWCAIGLVSDQAHTTAAALRHAVVATRWEAQRARREEKQLHRAVSLALHGDIQSKLTISAMVLDDLANRQCDRAEDLQPVVDSLTELSASLDLITVAQQRDLVETLDELQADWAGFAVVHRDVCSQVIASCRQSDGLSDAVARICQEAVSNAIRHGHADQVEITMRQVPGELTIDVRDNGTWRDSAPGLGTALLDELSTSWVICPAPAGTTLTAHLPTP